MFDNYVIDPKPSLRRRLLMATSIGLHVTAAVGLILYSVFHVEELAPPEIALTFFTAAPPPPPPPPPPAGATKKVEPKTTKIIKVPTTITPLPKEDPAPTPKEEPEAAGEPGGVPGGVVGGVAGGVVGGVVGGTPTAAPPPPPAAPKMVPAFVFDQQRLSYPDPRLPSDFVNRHPKQSLNTTYRICVNTAGQVTEVTPVRGMLGVDETVMAIVRTWRWKPQPLPVCTIRNFQFKID